jgi:hypothetical protein
MSRRWDAQSPDGIMQRIPGVGIIKIWSSKTTPTNAAYPNGYAPGCMWFYVPVNGPPQVFMNIGGNGEYIGNTQNTAANWIEWDATYLGMFGFGGANLPALTSGSVYRTCLTVANGISPSATGANKLVDYFTIPANTLVNTGQIIKISLWATVAAGSQIMSVYVNPTNTGMPSNPTSVYGTNAGVAGATDGTVTVTSGTSIGTATFAGTSGLVVLTLQLMKSGAKGSNTQESTVLGATAASTLGAWTDQTFTESAAIKLGITAQSATSAADIVYQGCIIEVFN